MYTALAPENLGSLTDTAAAWKGIAARAQEAARTTSAVALYAELSLRGVDSFDIGEELVAVYDTTGAPIDLNDESVSLLNGLIADSELHTWLAAEVFWAGDSGCHPFEGMPKADEPVTRVRLAESPEYLLSRAVGDIPTRSVLRKLNRTAR